MALKWDNIKKDLSNYGKFVGKTAGSIIAPTITTPASILGTALNTKTGQKAVNTVKNTITNRYGTIDTGNSKTTPTLKDIDAAYPTSTSGSTSSGTTSGGSSSGSYSSSSSVSGTPESIIDNSLAQMLEAYNQAADATKSSAKSAYEQRLTNLGEALRQAEETYNLNKDITNSTYDTKRSDLEKSIERFREQNALNVADQRKAYLSNQAALESARAEADRQSRIEAAARGLGGSGLQQLAQLQNLINQSQDISDLATENQSAVDKLRTALSQAEEDYNENKSNIETQRANDLRSLSNTLENARKAKEIGENEALTNYENTLKEVEAALAQNKANSNWDYGTTLSNILLRNSGGSSSSVDPYVSVVNGNVSATLNEFKDAYNSAKNDKGRQTAISDATSTLNNLLRNYGTDYSAIQTALDYVSNQKATKK